MQTVDLGFELSHSYERVIKTYHCTSIRRWFSPRRNGFITVTNQRLIYHTDNPSGGDKSMLVSEMPLNDVAGISVYVGTAINWLFALLSGILSVLIVPLLLVLLPEALISWQFGLLLMLPFAAVWLLSSGVLSEETRRQIWLALGVTDQAQVGVVPDQVRRWVAILGVAGGVIFVLALTSSIRTGFGTERILNNLVHFLLGSGLYVLIFGRQPQFELKIGSKTAKGGGITIPGASLLLFGRQSTAADTLTGEPAQDARTIARELGALLTDLRTLGEYGADRWRSGTTD